MTALARLAAFAILLVGVFGAATLAGGAVGPQTEDADGDGHEPHGHPDGDSADGAGAHGGHETEDAGGPGLAVAADGLRLVAARTRVRVGEPQRFAFRIVDDRGRAVLPPSFEEEQERKLHFIVVRRDLSGYQHLHPEVAADGTWSIALRLSEPGVYRAFADFQLGGAKRTLGVDVFAAGPFRPRPLPAPAQTARAAGYEVRLSTRDQAGPTELAFEVRRNGRRVRSLEPYLGARGHLVALREGDLAYLHVHPEAAGGPGEPIEFAAEYSSAGRYRLYLQFRHHGRVRTAEFTQQVNR